MTNEDRTPSISKTAFSCPHCGAFTTQYWYETYADPVDSDQRVPLMPSEDVMKKYVGALNDKKKVMGAYLAWADQIHLGNPFFGKLESGGHYSNRIVNNCNLSKCYNCKEIAVWIYDKLVYPTRKLEIIPCDDLPDNIKAIFNEARDVFSNSPKASAAMLRLAVQYICIELGGKGDNLNDDIGTLVSKGLDPMVQQALDVVRVIGNEAVHPGEIDLNDNRDVAIQLFKLVNLICDQMITQPERIKALYNDVVPENKRKSIEKRDSRNNKN